MEQTIDCVRLKDVMNYAVGGDIIYLGMLYENRTVIEHYCAGIMFKVI